jgi:uncharacterized protein
MRAACVAVLVCGATSGCTKLPEPAPRRSPVRISRAFSGAPAAAVLSQVPDVVIAQTVSGGPAVLEGLRERSVDVGMVMADAAYLAYTGQLERDVAPFEHLRGVAVVGLSVIHLIVGKAVHAKSISDLRNLRVGVGAKRSASAVTVDRLLHAFGLSLGDVRAVSVGSTEAADLLAKGQLDAAFIAIDIDPPEASGLIATKAGRTVIEIEGPPVELLRLQYPFLVKTLIPAETYPNQHSPIRTVGVDVLLACRADLDDDLVYRFMEAYFAVLARTSPTIDFDRAAAMTIPLHPGAARYYRQRELSR